MITNFFPPANTVASHRTYSFAKYLPDYGIDVSILTPERSGNLRYDLHGMKIITPYQDKSSINRFVRKPNIVKDLMKYTGVRPALNYLKSTLYRKGKRMLNAQTVREYDAVLVSFGPENVLRLGYYLNRKYGLPLIIDYRDLWIGNFFFRPTPLDKIVVRFIEGKIIRSASLVTAVSRGLSDILNRRYHIESKVIYNGFFDDIERNFSLYLDNTNDPKLIKMCYCGSLYNGAQPIQLVFPALSREEDLLLYIALFEDIDCRYIKKLAKQWNVEDRIVIYKNLSNEDAISLQYQCDLLLFLNSLDGSGAGTLSGKLFEYMAAKKYILGIGHRADEAAKIIIDLNLGGYTDSTDEVTSLIRKSKQWEGAIDSKVSFFTRRNQVKRMAEKLRKI